MQTRTNNTEQHVVPQQYGPNGQEVLAILGQFRSLDEHMANRLIIAMHNLELAQAIGANDDLSRLWGARGKAYELIHGELGDAWECTLKDARGCFEGFWQTAAVVAASTDALLGAICKPFIDPSDYEVLTCVWRTEHGQCDTGKTTLEQLRELKRENKRKKRCIDELEDKVAELETEINVCDLLTSRQTELLTGIANVLKGDPGDRKSVV